MRLNAASKAFAALPFSGAEMATPLKPLLTVGPAVASRGFASESVANVLRGDHLAFWFFSSSVATFR